MIPRFYLPQPFTVGARMTLPDALARHARVLRLRTGASLSLFNGAGGAFSAVVCSVHKGQIQVEIMAYDPEAGGGAEPPYQITLAQAITGSAKMDWLIEKAVELGVDRIVPLITAHSVVQWANVHAARRQTRWQAIAIAACQQCGRARVPEICAPLSLSDWLGRLHPATAMPDAAFLPRYLLSPQAIRGFESFPSEPPSEPVTVLVGPERGFTAAEERATGVHGFISVRLGPRILRAETAGFAVLAALAARWGSWNWKGVG